MKHERMHAHRHIYMCVYVWVCVCMMQVFMYVGVCIMCTQCSLQKTSYLYGSWHLQEVTVMMTQL